MMRCVGLSVCAALLLLMFTQQADAFATSAVVGEGCKKLVVRKCDHMAHGWLHLNDHQCFKLFCTEKTFADAQARCHEECGHLVSMHNVHEYDQVLCRLHKEDSTNLIRVWVGGKRQGPNGIFGWTDGTEFMFSRWNPNQPDNFNGEACMEMNWSVWGHWNDLDCSHKLRFVCAVNV